MLAFQNLHQVISNLPQVTSAFFAGSSRVSSTTVKKKQEVDVLCHESFLNSLASFRKSENLKIFENLPQIRFGPKFNDKQWIYINDLKLKFRADKSVKEDDFYILFNKKYLRSFLKSGHSFSLSVRSNSKKFGYEQKKLLESLEGRLNLGQSKWHGSFVSSRNFTENKQFSNCASGLQQFNKSALAYSSLLECRHDSLVIQRRGFKTRRSMETESQTGLGILGKKSAEERLGEKASDHAKSKMFLQIMEDENLSHEDKIRLKMSFAEGYMVAASEMKKMGRPGQWKALVADTAIKSILFSFFFILVSMILLGITGRKAIFPFNLSHHGEIDPEEVGVTFSDVKGVEEVKEELQEIVEFLRNPTKFSSMGGKLPKGVLLVGPPGTGKTLLARAVAGEANVPFFHASGSEFDEIFVGEGARRVRNLFRTAKARAPAIIFIDEIDCVGSKRKSTMLHPYANQTINQLLSEMDGFAKNEGVIVLGATNRKSDLDGALLRPGRFDVEVLVPLPDLEGRTQILDLYISKIQCKDIDVGKIAKATAGCTGADLEAMINHAAIRAATEGAEHVTMEHIENAKDKIMIGPERRSGLKSDEANLMTAYHEGGHTVVAYFSEGVGVVDKVTIVPRGESLGHTAVVPETDEKFITKAMCMARIDVALGGRAAEELVFGPNKITANASDDLEKATAIATTMVKNFGMSEKVGLRTLKNGEGELLAVNQYGQVVNDQVDLEVKRLIQESYKRAKDILRKHAKEHKLLAEALVKYKTLNPEDVKAILGDNSKDKTPAAS